MKIFIFCLFCFFLIHPVSAQEPDFAEPLQTKPSPVVVELFSSQNCPACPPADQFMGTLAKSQGVIALSCHVNYFGKTSGGFEREFCTDRQTRYNTQLGRKSYFTPQMMINGHMSEIGYETQKVSAKLVKGRSERLGEIAITPRGEGVYDFSLPAVGRVEPASLWLAVYDKPHQINERGRNTTYYNAVKRYIPLGAWNGSSLSRAVYPILDQDTSGFAIVAQENTSGKILAAGDFKL